MLLLKMNGLNLYAVNNYSKFGMAVVNNKVTTVGGISGGIAITSLQSLCQVVFKQGSMYWDRSLPPMAEARVNPATFTTPSHLVVAGGYGTKVRYWLDTVEALSLNTFQWSLVGCLPFALEKPSLALCDSLLYFGLSREKFSCSVEDLVNSLAMSRDIDWTQLADIPQIEGATLAAFNGNLLAIGGQHRSSFQRLVKNVHCYDRSTNSWSVIGEMPTPRACPLVAVLPSNELIVVGGSNSDTVIVQINSLNCVISSLIIV